MENNFYYDDFSDRLMISRKKLSDRITGSVRVLNVTLDFTTDNRIVNVEIKNISEYLTSLGINADILTELEEAKLMFKQYRDGYMIYFILKAKQGNVERIPFNVPMSHILSAA